MRHSILILTIALLSVPSGRFARGTVLKARGPAKLCMPWLSNGLPIPNWYCADLQITTHNSHFIIIKSH